MNSTRAPLLNRIVRCQSGAMAVVGMFMAVFLAAGLFYIVGTAEAIIYRQRVQDTADAMAYSAAGIHARGMNLIVLLNLIMAALLAVYVFMKLIQRVAFIVALITCPWVPPVCGGAKFVERTMKTASKAYESVLNIALPALNYGQIGVAIGTPWVATLKNGSHRRWPIQTGRRRRQRRQSFPHPAALRREFLQLHNEPLQDE